ncbi:MAG TPA: SLATT domain-containing protein [Pyrinomonadaceae bacterium]|nr:SLATT domain-containing protein [Pyrinomonadaceae bacterium]
MSQSQMEYLSEAISNCISLNDKKRQKNKFLAFGIKATSTGFAATITILLGLTVREERKALFANIALVLSAVITLLNTWDAFFNHRALWLRFTVATQSLRTVQEELDYLGAKTHGEPTAEQLDYVHRKFKRVIFALNRDWENLRRESEKTTAEG